MKRLHIWFIMVSLFFFVTSSVAFYLEHNREWKQYQRKFRQIEYDTTKGDYEKALKAFVESGDKARCKELADEIKDLKDPSLIKSKKKEIAKIRSIYKLDWYESRLPKIQPGFLDNLRNFIFVDFLHPTNKINQIYLPGINHRVDRCTTCHMAIDRPGFEEIDRPDVKKTPRLGFKNKGLPFTTHSEFELIIKDHPPEKFGCTICHQGQGRATNDKAARGEVPHFEEPILPAKYIESSCGKCHFGLDELKGAPRLSKARELFKKHNCFDCHTIDREDLRALATGKTGPPLTYIGSKRVDELNWGTVTNIPRTKWDWHFAHLKNPKLFAPDTEMPAIDLTDEEVEALTNFVLGFVDEKIDHDYLVQPKISGGEQGITPESLKKEEEKLDMALEEL